jgi:outer membrane assembly lipoprotein YfiO
MAKLHVSAGAVRLAGAVRSAFPSATSRIGRLAPLRSTAIGCCLLAGFALVGCSANPKPEPEAAEIPLGDVTAVDTPEEALFFEAKRYYATELYTVARESFKSLAASYALGAYAEFAEIKAADAYFETNEFDVARTMYADLIKNRPASRALPYLMMRAGRSNQLSHRGVGRDPQALEKALEMYDQLIARYPTSVYADSARVYRTEVIRDLERSERLVADFYARRKNEPAVAARQATIEQKWTPLMNVSLDRTGVDVARYMPEVALPNAPRPTAAAPAWAVKPGTPSAAVPPPTGSASGVASTETESLNPGGINIVRATCQAGPPAQVYLYLNRALPSGALETGETIPPSPEGTLRLPLRGVGSRGLEIDCFGARDMTVSPTGTVELRTPKGATVMSLRNPNRLLLVLER